MAGGHGCCRRSSQIVNLVRTLPKSSVHGHELQEKSADRDLAEYAPAAAYRRLLQAHLQYWGRNLWKLEQANRVALWLQKKWKYGDDKLMPIKQCLEERIFVQSVIPKEKPKIQHYDEYCPGRLT